MSLRLLPTRSGFLRSAVALGMLTGSGPSLSQVEDQPTSPVVQILRASEWKGGSDTAFEACKANSGEYTLWVYAKGDTCGVPREQADRVVMFRQPLPGVSPIRATSRVPAVVRDRGVADKLLSGGTDHGQLKIRAQLGLQRDLRL